jgi:hypothetical protein
MKKETNTIVVVGCTKTKKAYRCKASEMYSESTLFQKTIRYINSYYYLPYVILSAKYGIITPETVIDPYDVSITGVSKNTEDYNKILWDVAAKLGDYDKIIALCGSPYVNTISKVCVGKVIVEPMKGMGIGQRLQFLDSRCDC